MRRLTLAVLLDAFRPDYLRHAPFLAAIAGGRAAKLREPFGFLPRAAYFGGLSPEQYGFSNMYARDPERSPFGVVRGLRGPALEPMSRRLGLRAFIDASAQRKVDRFARPYASSASIPLTLAAEFTIVEQTAPWDRRAGYRSLFHDLDDAGERWFECSWPGTNELDDRTDRGILRSALAKVTGRERFGFVHFQELDGRGHQFGPGSREVRETIAATDACLGDLVRGLERRFDVVDLLAFGDHGMVPVTRCIDLGRLLEQLPCEAPRDYSYFLDSTMARFWFESARAESMVRQCLSATPGGRLLDEEDARRFRIAGCDARNARLIFLADPGVVIHPNFFQSEGPPPLGMHGYDPDCTDNLGILVCRSDLVDPPAGIVDATGLYPLLRRMTELDRVQTGVPAATETNGASGASVPAVPRFTQVSGEPADRAVAAHLEAITSTIVRNLGTPRAIVLTGSFGRGEGGVFRDGSVYRPVNDYDVLVVDDTDKSWALREIGYSLPAQLGIDFLDLAWADGGWQHCPPTIANFDLKYGSTVLLGDATVLDGLPTYVSRDVPLIEGVQLLLNRIAGLLSGMHHGRRDPKASRYLINQYVKAATAIGDTHLLEWGCYDASYATRRQRFGELAPGVGIETDIVSRIVQGYSLKMVPDYAAVTDVDCEIRALTPLVIDRLRETISACAGRISPGDAEASRPQVLSLEEAMRAYVDLTRAEGAGEDDYVLRQYPAIASLAKPGDAMSLRQAVYAALPMVLLAASDVSPRFSPTGWIAGDRLRLPPAVNGWLEWDGLRAKVVDSWFATIH